tara:strand:+ start:216 stop:731 length:516 start_codon:yes stop_codon:yes gene_type:complete
VGFYNAHLRKTSDPTPISKNKLERGMVVKIKYKKDIETKLYLVFVLQPKWPNTTEGKLHGLSLDAIPLNKLNEISKEHDEVVSTSSKVKKLDLAKIQINEASKTFYTTEIKMQKQLKAGYRTFNLMDIKSIQAVNYDWGKYDKVSDRNERRLRLEEEARERKEQEENKKTK